MKKILVFSTLIIVWMLPTFGQSVWDNILLADNDAKIISGFQRPHFGIALTSNVSFVSTASQYFGIEQIKQAAFSPGTAEQLFEKIGGEFFIGNFSDPSAQNVKLSGAANLTPGLRLDIDVGRRVEFRTGIQYYKARWSGTFPVFVLPHFQSDPTQPQYFQGVVNASLSAVLLDMEAVFFVAMGKFRPYAKAGIRRGFSVENSIRAELAGVPLSLEFNILESKFSAFAGSGLRWLFGKKLFLESGFSFGKRPGDGYQLAAEANFGWKF